MKVVGYALMITLVVVAIVLAQDARSRSDREEPEIVFFFSDATRDLEEAARRLRNFQQEHSTLPIQLVYLVEDFASIANPPNHFATGIRELQRVKGADFSLAVFDEDGLKLADDLKLDRLPAFVFRVHKGRRAKVCISYGSQTNLEDLLKCAK